MDDLLFFRGVRERQAQAAAAAAPSRGGRSAASGSSQRRSAQEAVLQRREEEPEPPGATSMAMADFLLSSSDREIPMTHPAPKRRTTAASASGAVPQLPLPQSQSSSASETDKRGASSSSSSQEEQQEDGSLSSSLPVSDINGAEQGARSSSSITTSFVYNNCGFPAHPDQARGCSESEAVADPETTDAAALLPKNATNGTLEDEDEKQQTRRQLRAKQRALLENLEKHYLNELLSDGAREFLVEALALCLLILGNLSNTFFESLRVVGQKVLVPLSLALLAGAVHFFWKAWAMGVTAWKEIRAPSRGTGKPAEDDRKENASVADGAAASSANTAGESGADEDNDEGRSGPGGETETENDKASSYAASSPTPDRTGESAYLGLAEVVQHQGPLDDHSEHSEHGIASPTSRPSAAESSLGPAQQDDDGVMCVEAVGAFDVEPSRKSKHEEAGAPVVAPDEEPARKLVARVLLVFLTFFLLVQVPYRFALFLLQQWEKASNYFHFDVLEPYCRNNFAPTSSDDGMLAAVSQDALISNFVVVGIDTLFGLNLRQNTNTNTPLLSRTRTLEGARTLRSYVSFVGSVLYHLITVYVAAVTTYLFLEYRPNTGRAMVVRELRNTIRGMKNLDNPDDVNARCVTCWTAKKTVLLLPCAHLCVCKECFDVHVMHYGRRCPVCRARVMKYLHPVFI